MFSLSGRTEWGGLGVSPSFLSTCCAALSGRQFPLTCIQGASPLGLMDSPCLARSLPCMQ